MTLSYIQHCFLCKREQQWPFSLHLKHVFKLKQLSSESFDLPQLAQVTSASDVLDKASTLTANFSIRLSISSNLECSAVET